MRRRGDGGLSAMATTKVRGMRIPDELWNAVQAKADREHTSVTAVAIRKFNEYLMEETATTAAAATLYIVQGDYGQGWEDLTASADRDEAMEDLRAYRENTNDRVRFIKRRVQEGSTS